MGFNTPDGNTDAAPTDAEYVVLTTNTDLDQERVLNAGTGLTTTDTGAEGTATLDIPDGLFTGPTTDAGLSLGGGYTILDTNNPVFLELTIRATTDGTSNARVDINIDESGGTTPDYSFIIFTESDTGSGIPTDETISVYLPAGGAVEIANTSDPAGDNQLRTNRKLTL
jgi:hypothetical protein